MPTYPFAGIESLAPNQKKIIDSLISHIEVGRRRDFIDEFNNNIQLVAPFSSQFIEYCLDLNAKFLFDLNKAQFDIKYDINRRILILDFLYSCIAQHCPRLIANYIETHNLPRITQLARNGFDFFAKDVFGFIPLDFAKQQLCTTPHPDNLGLNYPKFCYETIKSNMTNKIQQCIEKGDAGLDKLKPLLTDNILKHIDINQALPNGRPLLCYALFNNAPQTAVYLIKLGADINAVDQFGKTVTQHFEEFCQIVLSESNISSDQHAHINQLRDILKSSLYYQIQSQQQKLSDDPNWKYYAFNRFVNQAQMQSPPTIEEGFVPTAKPKT